MKNNIGIELYDMVTRGSSVSLCYRKDFANRISEFVLFVNANVLTGLEISG